jgi:hypothetical protein
MREEERKWEAEIEKGRERDRLDTKRVARTGVEKGGRGDGKRERDGRGGEGKEKGSYIVDR